MRIAYSDAQKLEAVTLAAVVGAETAAEQLAIDPRTVRKWSDAAGHRPELDGPTDQLQALHDLTLARVTADVAAGKIKGTQLMTVWGIARDKLDRAKARAERALAVDPEPQASLTPLTDAAHQRWEDWLDTLPERDAWDVKRRLRDEIDRALEGRTPDTEPLETADTDAQNAAGWDALLVAVQADLPRVRADARAAEALEAARRDQWAKAGRWLDDETADLLIAAEQELSA